MILLKIRLQSVQSVFYKIPKNRPILKIRIPFQNKDAELQFWLV